jgi:hypothetical protein
VTRSPPAPPFAPARVSPSHRNLQCNSSVKSV